MFSFYIRYTLSLVLLLLLLVVLVLRFVLHVWNILNWTIHRHTLSA